MKNETSNTAPETQRNYIANINGVNIKVTVLKNNDRIHRSEVQAVGTSEKVWVDWSKIFAEKK